MMNCGPCLRGPPKATAGMSRAWKRTTPIQQSHEARAYDASERGGPPRGRTRSHVDAALSINDVEDVPVRILEPGDLHVAGDVDVALALHVRHVVVLERDALDLERAHDVVQGLA